MAKKRNNAPVVNNPWLLPLPSRKQAKVRLFCFVYGGGSPIAFKNWHLYFPESVEIVAINLPGRHKRMRESHIKSWATIIDKVEQAIISDINIPYAFFGHSFGACLAFELTKRLQKKKLNLPSCLIVSACKAPNKKWFSEPTHNLPTKKFYESLRKMEGIPEEIIENDKMMRFFEPALRADFGLIESWHPDLNEKIEVPIIGFAGENDRVAPANEMTEWELYTNKNFNLEVFPGNHFFVNTYEIEVTEVVFHVIKTVFKNTTTEKFLVKKTKEISSTTPEPDTYVAPRNETELKICRAWQRIISVPRVGITDDFFHICGDSLKAIQLSYEMTKILNRPIDVSTIFINRTIENILHSEQSEENIDIKPYKGDKARLSLAQERLWFVESYQEGTQIYHIPIVLVLKKNCDVKQLSQALKLLVQRHEVLRTNFIVGMDGISYQNIQNRDLMIKEVYLKKNKNLKKEIAKDILKKFDLINGLPIQVYFYYLDKDCIRVLINVHHIVFDGWSIKIFLEELDKYYAHLSEGSPLELDIPTIHYKDFSEWQRFYLTHEDLSNDLEYWKTYLIDYKPLELYTDQLRPKQIDYSGSTYSHVLNLDLSNLLRLTAKLKGVSLFTILLAGFMILLGRYSNQEDVLIGLLDANRPFKQLWNMLGFFVNLHPIRAELTSNKTIDQLISEIQHNLIDGQLHRNLPFNQLIDGLEIARDPSRHPLFQVLFSVQGFESQFTDEYRPYFYVRSFDEVNYPIEQYDLRLFVNDQKEKLVCQFGYQTRLFFPETIKRMSIQYEKILNQIVENMTIKLNSISLLTQEEYDYLVFEKNKTTKYYPKDKTISQLFEDQVKKTPNNVAVFLQNQNLTYDMLNKKANQLARLIKYRYKKLTRNAIIGLCVQKSFDMLIAILAIFKIGAAYVPLDPNYPDDRLEYMIKDSHEGLLITQEEIISSHNLLKSLASEEVLILNSKKTKAELNRQSDKNLSIASTPNDLAYIIYTSGSTGNPKGVMNSHIGPINTILAINARLNANEKDRTFSLSNYSFDLSLYDFFGMFFSGGAIVLIDKNDLMDASKWVQLLNEHHITIWNSVPQLAQILMDYLSNTGIKHIALRAILLSGDSIPKKLLYAIRKFHQEITLINLYGVTEASIWSIWYEIHSIDSRWNVVPCGKPMPNQAIYILDISGNPSPIDVPGEIYLGGDGVAKGYLNKKEKTEQTFLNHNTFGYIYKSGDIGKWRLDGNIEFLGRKDFQVKVRGYRIELDEIKNVLLQYNVVTQVLVITKKHMEQQYIVAYYTTDKDKSAPQVQKLRDYLNRHLPNYMMPDAFIKLDKMPLTPNGKIDRKALPEPDFAEKSIQYAAPTNATEEQLCEIWSKYLPLPISAIGIKNNFFSMGGSSILAMQTVHEINKKLNVSLKVSDIFSQKTIERLANLILSTDTRYRPINLMSETIKGKPTLWMVHPSASDSEVYQELADKLKSDFNCVGIDNYNLHHELKIDELYKLAKFYLKTIKKTQYFNQDNIILLGWSLGGRIALEMVAQLEQAGYKNIKVILLDTAIINNQTKAIFSNIDKLAFDNDLLEMHQNVAKPSQGIKELITSEVKLLHSPINEKLKFSKVILFKASKISRLLDKHAEVKKLAKYIVESKDNNLNLVSNEVTIILSSYDHYNILQDVELITSYLKKLCNH